MRIFKIIVLFSIAVAGLLSCQEKQKVDDQTTIDVSFVIPASADMIPDGEFTFSVSEGKAPLNDDVLLLEHSETGVSSVCRILVVSSESFTVKVPSSLSEGNYIVYIKRSDIKKQMGTVYVRIISDIGFVPEKGNNVYGLVSCGGEGVPGVVVSDGYIVTKTDENGYYQFHSGKENKTVFVSVPGGYEPVKDGIVPKFYGFLSGGEDDVEQVNFQLVSVDTEDYALLVFGDMHLAARSENSDRTQFRRFADDVNEFMSASSGKKIYALTLGDMTWDLYWTENSYAFKEYIDDMNSLIDGNLMVYHTIGNHDHSMDGMGDFNKTAQYRSYLGPTYYSFNIGKYHYIVLDDIDFMGNISDRDNYVEDVSSDQLAWLTRDLAEVPADVPIIVATHAPIYKDNDIDPGVRLVNASVLLSSFEGRNVHILTGHTHRIANKDNIGDSSMGHFEHNAGAVCADWWWSYQESGILISTDGTPGGYSVFDLSGDSMQWRYKATDFSDSYQFRTYYLNNVEISYKYVSNADADHKKNFDRYVSAYPLSSDNEVLINIWNWDPKWSLSVTEEGKELEYTRVVAYDPLHIIAYTAKRLDKNKTATFPTQRNNHFFKVKASSPTSTLEIKVTDRFGNIYTETMTRPKAFDIDTYREVK